MLPDHAASLIIRSRGDDSTERRAHSRGELVRVAAGRYVAEAAWRGLGREARVVVRTLAALDTLRTTVVVSHLSAAALWGMPLVGRAPMRVSTTDPSRMRTHTGRYLTKYAGTIEPADVSQLGCVRVTAPARTAVDVALTSPSRGQAVAVLDHCLRTGLCTIDDYRAALERRGRLRGATRASWVGEFASPLAGSAGESVMRVTIDGLGFPPPELQHPFVDGEGLIGYGDFWWREFGALDEFDGLVKYRDASMRGGLASDEVVVAEKIREDRIRALPEVHGVARSVWGDLAQPQRVTESLLRIGVPRVRAGFRTL